MSIFQVRNVSVGEASFLGSSAKLGLKPGRLASEMMCAMLGLFSSEKGSFEAGVVMWCDPMFISEAHISLFVSVCTWE